jgi:predicted alpha/beta-hydrolase family hydrolase
MSEFEPFRTSAVQFVVREDIGSVSGILFKTPEAGTLFVMGHGAGAGIHHPFMQGVARELAYQGISTFRYQFPYMERGRKIPDQHHILKVTVRSALKTGHELCPGKRIVIGGKSMAGRMTSLAAADHQLANIEGLIFLGFPLHPADKPSMERGKHLEAVRFPMLFLQGTRDRLADSGLVQGLCRKLGTPATLRWIDEGDHSFGIPKRVGRDSKSVFEELARSIQQWLETVLAS